MSEHFFYRFCVSHTFQPPKIPKNENFHDRKNFQKFLKFLTSLFFDQRPNGRFLKILKQTALWGIIEKNRRAEYIPQKLLRRTIVVALFFSVSANTDYYIQGNEIALCPVLVSIRDYSAGIHSILPVFLFRKFPYQILVSILYQLRLCRLNRYIDIVMSPIGMCHKAHRSMRENMKTSTIITRLKKQAENYGCIPEMAERIDAVEVKA